MVCMCASAAMSIRRLHSMGAVNLALMYSPVCFVLVDVASTVFGAMMHASLWGGTYPKEDSACPKSGLHCFLSFGFILEIGPPLLSTFSITLPSFMLPLSSLTVPLLSVFTTLPHIFISLHPFLSPLFIATFTIILHSTTEPPTPTFLLFFFPNFADYHRFPTTLLTYSHPSY